MVCACVCSGHRVHAEQHLRRRIETSRGDTFAQIKQKKMEQRHNFTSPFFSPLLWLDRLLAISSQFSYLLIPSLLPFSLPFFFLLSSFPFSSKFFSTHFTHLSLSASLPINTPPQYLIYNQRSTVDGRYFNSSYLPSTVDISIVHTSLY